MIEKKFVDIYYDLLDIHHYRYDAEKTFLPLKTLNRNCMAELLSCFSIKTRYSTRIRTP